MLSSLTPRQWRIIVALLAVLATVLIALIGVQLFGGDDAAAPTTSAASTTTIPDSTTTTSATTTSTTAQTTSTTDSTTTTEAQTTTTSQATTTTSTSLPTPPDLLLEPDGLGVVDFGSSPAETIAIITAAVGQNPDVDTGWVDAFDNPYGTCPPPEVRGVEWGMLVILLTKAETDFAAAGTEHFFSYTYAPQPEKPGAGPHGLETDEGIGLGSTRSQVEAAYGSRVQFFEDEVFGIFFQIDFEPESQEALGGLLTGPDPTHVVSSLIGGVGCGE